MNDSLLNDETGREYGTRPLLQALLRIAVEVIRLCDANGIRYYFDSGSALGAVRHGGFIPWDDDIDIAMTRDDYEKFISVARRELPDGLALVHYTNTPERWYMHSFSKVQCTDRELVDSLESQIGFRLSQGVAIDIFPLDGMPRNGLERYWWLTRYYSILIAAASFRSQREGLLARYTWQRPFIVGLGTVLRLLFYRVRRPDDLVVYTDRLFKTHRVEVGRECGYLNSCISGHGLLTCSVPYEVYGEGRLVPFERIIVRIPEKADSYLRTFYGDYMQFPPMSKRHPEHCANSPILWLENRNFIAQKNVDYAWKYGPTDISVRKIVAPIVLLNFDDNDEAENLVRQIRSVDGGEGREILVGAGCSEKIERVLSKHGRLIVMTQGARISEALMSYMDEALEFYFMDKLVWCVNGAQHEGLEVPHRYHEDVFIAPCHLSRVWGFWHDRWQAMGSKDLLSLSKSAKEIMTRHGLYAICPCIDTLKHKPRLSKNLEPEAAFVRQM